MIAVGQCFWRDRVAVLLYVMALKEHSDLHVETPPCLVVTWVNASCISVRYVSIGPNGGFVPCRFHDTIHHLWHHPAEALGLGFEKYEVDELPGAEVISIWPCFNLAHCL